MGITLLLAASGSLMAPHITAAVSQEVHRDYPRSLLRKDGNGSVKVAVWVDPKGKIYDCTPLAYIGERPLVYRVCGKLRGQVVNAATDANGEAAYGYVIVPVRYIGPDGFYRIDEEPVEIPGNSELPDLELAVENYPHDMGPSITARFQAHIAADGLIADCKVDGIVPEPTERYICAQVNGQASGIGHDRKGEPVAYVRSMKVTFTPAESS